MGDLIKADNRTDLGRPVDDRHGPEPLRPIAYPLAAEDGVAIPLHAYLDRIWKRRWLLAAVAATVLLVTALQVFTATPLYLSTLILQVDPEDANVLPYRGVAGSPTQLSRGEYLWTQAGKLETRSLSGRVSDRLNLGDNEVFNEPISRGFVLQIIGGARGLARSLFSPSVDNDKADRQNLVNRLLGHLEVTPVRNTRLIEVDIQAADPELAANIANTFAEEFIEQHLESKFEATTRATQFLQAQLEDLKIKVEKSEEELLQYARAKNIVNPGEREGISQRKLSDLSEEATRAQSSLLTKESRHLAAKRAGKGDFPEELKTDAMRSLESRRAEFQQELTALGSRVGQDWPGVRELEEKISGLEAQLDAEKARLTESTRLEYLLAKDGSARLTDALGQQRKLVERLDEDSIQYRILEREVKTNKELYEGLLQRLKEAGVAAGLRSSNIRVADAAVVARAASSPRRMRSLGMALFLGLVLGVGAVFLAEALDNSLRSTDDVRDVLGLPSLGVVPHLAPAEGLKRMKLLPGSKKNSRTEPMLAFTGAAFGDGRHWEAYRSLRTSIQLSSSRRPPRTLLVSSALPNEGKTTTAANIAVALAQAARGTVLVDLDLRRPTLASVFGLSSKAGMSEYLSGNTDLISVIHPTKIPNLHLVPAGNPAPNPAELIGAGRMRQGLRDLEKMFDYVVFDSPPFLEITDALVLSPHVDGVILVARSGQTPKDAVRQAAEQLLRVGGKLLGVLVNDVDQQGGSYSYYHSGSGRGYWDSVDRAGDKPSKGS